MYRVTDGDAGLAAGADRLESWLAWLGWLAELA